MTPEKPLEPKHVIHYDIELLATDHHQAELQIWDHRLGHLPLINIRILTLLAITPKMTANMNPPKY